MGERLTASPRRSYRSSVHTQRITAQGRAAVRVARLLAVTATAAAVTAVALPLVGGLGYVGELFASPEVVVAVSFSVTGAVLVASDAARRIGWLLVVVGLASGIYVLAVSSVAWSLDGDVDAALPSDAAWWVPFAAWASTWAWFPAWALVATVLPHLVPYGRPLSRRWLAPIGVGLVVLVVGVVGLAVQPGPLGFFTGIENPFAVPVLARAFDVLAPALDVVVPSLALLAVASVVVRFRRADGVERRQVGWFGYSVVLAVVLIVVGPSWLVNIAVLLVPTGIAVAALRYRLYDLDLLVNRTLVGGVLLAGAVLAYVALVAWVGALFGTDGGITTFAAAFAVALAFHPARVAVQRGVDRLLFGQRRDPYSLVRRLDDELRRAESPRAALAAAAELVRDGLRFPGVAVMVPVNHGGPVREESGTVADDVVTLPLLLHGEQVGELLVVPRPPQTQLAGADQRVLAALTGPIASAAYALRLSGDLEESRGRLVGAREEERLRLRRDLHDGLGPQLAGVVMGLDTARAALGRGDDAKAERLVGTATSQAKEAVDDVRRLVHGLRPPALDELGLLGALATVGPAVVEGGPRVEITADGDLTALPAAVEVAAYRIASEAVTNAARHAAAARIAVRLRGTDEAVRVEVTDDGRGLGADRTPGVGIASMRERAAELGGWCTVGANEPRGTKVVAMLPRRLP